MWVFRYARFIRSRQSDQKRSLRSLPLWFIERLMFGVQLVLMGVVLLVVLFVAISLPRAIDIFTRAYREASSTGKADKHSKLARGGEVRQAGYQEKISATRYGASTRSDDLRRRLNELRSMRTGNPAHRPQNLGSQYGKHEK